MMVKVKLDTEIPDVLSTKDAVTALGISYSTLFRWLKKGRVMAVKIGGRTLIATSEIARLKKEEK